MSKVKMSVRRYIPLIVSGLLLAIAFATVGEGNVVNEIERFAPARVGFAFVCVLSIPFWVSLRFWMVLGHFGLKLPWKPCFLANISGQVASLFVIPLFGQVAGRQFLLSKFNVTATTNAAIAAYERTSTALISGACALIGAINLSGTTVVKDFVNGFALIPILLTIGLGLALSVSLSISRRERSLYFRLLSLKSVVNLAKVFSVSFAGYLVMLLAFAVLFQGVAPDLTAGTILSACAIVSFAASMPISVGGWGLREVATIYVLSFLGVPADEALAVSVVIGVLSTLGVLLVGAVVSKWQISPKYIQDFQGRIRIRPDKLERDSSWVLGMVVGMLIFFQVYLPIGDATVNVNLSDPFAILALTTVLFTVLSTKKMPDWKVPRFNGALLLMTIMWGIGFLWGYFNIGFTSWAFSGKLMGWFVLLGYLSAGYLLVKQHGQIGFERGIETLLSVASAVVVVTILMRLGYLPTSNSENFAYNFEGFSGNRNAFAFQMIAVIAVIFGGLSALTANSTNKRKTVLVGVFLGVVLQGLIWSGSRTALVSFGTLLLVGLYLKIVTKRPALIMLALAGLICMLPYVIQFASQFISLEDARALALQTKFSYAQSDSHRWAANAIAFELWQSSPFFGIGLGGFLSKSAGYFGFPMVVHSTPLWILVEFGLFGFMCILYVLFLLVKQLSRCWNEDAQGKGLLLLLLAFILFSLLHEMLFQRIFWFLLGLLLANFSKKSRPRQKEPKI